MNDTWDENKRRSNIERRGGEYDFALLEYEFGWAKMERFSAKPGPGGEVRWMAVGIFRGKLRTVVYTERDGGRRYISFRRAHESERRRYHERKERIS